MHTHNQNLSVAAAVLTVSDTRTKENDKSGALIRELLSNEGHTAADYAIVKDETAEIVNKVLSWSRTDGIQAVIITGGTGFSPRDVTHEALVKIFDKEMTGFGELFRRLSYDEIGVKAMFSRAAAGSINGRPVYAMPGSSNAVMLGMKKLVLPSIQHFTEELNRI
ncbi:molybdenum cofactor biosynthesis protein [Bacillus mangrovi]|uniref:Molybdenum cofactor biosynthesis protein B n=1 Tax=Metabacillus mangrovi TaxID=1491830 RepID=A0A7X2S1J2_9BACI|nr:molybdenum cofactor biosynthesis protein [Metabacillus mangrovi]